MNPDDIARILDDLGQRLGPTGEYVFSLAVRQVVIDAVITLAWTVPVLLVLLGAAVWGARFTRRHYAAAKAKSMPDGYSWERVDLMDYVFAWTFPGMGGGFAALYASWAALTAIGRLLNPEYAALRDILQAIAR